MIIAIEGSDQAGKLTQSRLLERALKRSKIRTRLFHFPDYSTPIGAEIRRYLDGKRRFTPQAIHCLLAANRWERLPEITRAAEKNSVLIMNRYYHSNIAYGMANGLKESWLEGLDRGLPGPNLVILLDVTKGESFQRQRSKRDKFERNGTFLSRVSKAYLAMARKKRWKVIDASRPRSEIHDEIMGALGKKLGLLGPRQKQT